MAVATALSDAPASVGVERDRASSAQAEASAATAHAAPTARGTSRLFRTSKRGRTIRE
jgi:hypothetical protein